MLNCISIDSTSPNSYIKIRDFLLTKLQSQLTNNNDIIFLCIGSDRCTGDSLGPLVGYKLQFTLKDKIHIYGSLESPIHSKNLVDILEKIYTNFEDPYIIAIDSCLGKLNTIGKIFIEEKSLQPGLALNKNLPSVGNLSITGIVNIGGSFEFMILQNTKLYTVMLLADCIADGIRDFILKSSSKDSKCFNKSLDDFYY